MKLQGLLKGKGKLGSIVVSSVAGTSIAREYNPNVSNPSTQAQTTQRARLKLASQLAAAYASVIAIPRDGLKSSRNLFVKKNFQYIIGTNGAAQVSYENLQLTNGNTGLPALRVTRSQENGVIVRLAEDASASVSRVVYIIFRKTTEDQLQLVGSDVQTIAGDNGDFQDAFPYLAGDLVVYAYGMKDLNDKAAASYGNYAVSSGEDIATLVFKRAINASDFQFTQTRGVTLFDGESESSIAGDDESMVYLTATTGGTVAANGLQNGRMAVANGTSVTATATADSGYTFKGWQKNGETGYLSTDNPYTFEVNEMVDLVAVFEKNSTLPGGGGGGD